MELNDIMVKYGTDKQSELHNYVKFYDSYFSPIKEKKLKILEIGIYRPPLNGRATVGASLKTWYDYFSNSKIIGLDVDNFTDVDNDRIFTFIANQEKRVGDETFNGLNNIIEKFGDDFDIIIDDGGHTMRQQQITLGYMFKFLKSNGLFVIEDLHTSYFAQHAYNNTNTINTTLKIIQDYIKTGTFNSEFMLDEEKKYLIENIESIELLKGNSSEIVFIRKK